MTSYDDPSLVKRRFNRACTNRDVRKVVLAAVNAGVPARLTKKGVILYGQDGGSAGAHYTASDARAAANLKAELRRIGYDIK
jgi:hypothetical protein